MHIIVSSAQTIGAFNKDLDTVNLHRPTKGMAIAAHPGIGPGRMLLATSLNAL